MGTGVISRGKEGMGKVKLSPSAQIKQSWSYTSNPPVRHHGEERDKFTCTQFIIPTVLKVLHNAIFKEDRNYIYRIFTLFSEI